MKFNRKNMNRKILFIFILFAKTIYGQQDAQSSFYFFNPLNFNPAYAGTRGTFNITAVSRLQWTGWDGAPNTQFLSIHTPIVRERIGVGATVSYDKIGARSSLNTSANFSYHLQLNENNLRLSLGLSAMFQQQRYNFSGLQVTDPSDPNYQIASSSISPNFGWGAYLYDKRFYMGISTPRLLKQSIDNNNNELSFLQPHFYFMGGYVFKINSVVDLKTSTLIKTTSNTPSTTDLNISGYFYKIFWTGVMYRFNESIGFNTSIQINDNLMVGYAFDYPINSMHFTQLVTNELVVCIDLKSKKKAYLSPRYF